MLTDTYKSVVQETVQSESQEALSEFLCLSFSSFENLGLMALHYEEFSLLECCAVWVLLEPTFRRKVLLQSSGRNNQGARNNISDN
jgi:hypothetical protein